MSLLPKEIIVDGVAYIPRDYIRERPQIIKPRLIFFREIIGGQGEIETALSPITGNIDRIILRYYERCTCPINPIIPTDSQMFSIFKRFRLDNHYHKVLAIADMRKLFGQEEEK